MAKNNPGKAIGKWSRAALKACDWFVNNQIIQQRPNWDANHGRFMYNVHRSSDFRTMGIGWTQARAVMCLLTGYELTGNEKYFESAKLGIGYVKTLQNLDARHSLTYGAFHEETPHSTFSFPRDAIEIAEALMEWGVAAKDNDALDRANLFFKWFQKNALKSYADFGWWIAGAVAFDGTPEPEGKKPHSCEAGCGWILAHAYRLTGKAIYKQLLVKIADQTLKQYGPKGVGPFSENVGKQALGHHTTADGAIHNDDGAGITLLAAHSITGKQQYLDAVLRVADYYAARQEPLPIYSGTAAVANLLVEADAAAGDGRYRKAAERYAREVLKLQDTSKDKRCSGAFIGEDEGGKWYVPGSANDDFVTTRVTAYSTLALFKLDGCKVRGYSVSRI